MSDLKQNIIDLQSILSTVDDMGSTTEVNVLPKEIMKDKISYGPSGKIVGVAPFSLVKSGMSELPFTDNWVSAAWGNNTFVAIAQNSNAAAYSTDGISWNSTTLPKIANWRKVIFGNGMFIAIAYGENIVAYSTNGITWNSSKIGTTDNWITAAFGNGNFVIVAQNSSIALHSTDGINWERVSILKGVESWVAAAWNGDTFLAVSEDGVARMSSTDGISWTVSLQQTKLGEVIGLVPSNSSSFLAITSTGVTSNISATSTVTNSSQFNSIQCIAPLFKSYHIMIANNNTVAKFQALTTIEEIATLPNCQWCDLVTNDEKVIAIARNSKVIQYTTDVDHWTNESIDTYKLESVESDKGVILTAENCDPRRVYVENNQLTMEGVAIGENGGTVSLEEYEALENELVTALTSLANAQAEIIALRELATNTFMVSATAPADTSILWIDTNTTTGGLKYYNSISKAWLHVPVAWA